MHTYIPQHLSEVASRLANLEIALRSMKRNEFDEWIDTATQEGIEMLEFLALTYDRQVLLGLEYKVHQSLMQEKLGGETLLTIASVLRQALVSKGQLSPFLTGSYDSWCRSLCSLSMTILKSAPNPF